MAQETAHADDFQIDSHKLHLHPERVARWLAGEPVAPIYMEFSPSGACNHRCSFCGMDFMGYQPRFLPPDRTAARLAEWAEAGLKSIMFCGEGEPFLNKNTPDMAVAAKNAGIDVAFTTNGVLLGEDTARRVLPVTSWIKVSCNAGGAETYARVHGTDADDFGRALANLEQAAELRARHGWTCTLGMQMILLPENRREAPALAARAARIGMDYLVIKPYAVHRLSTKTGYRDLTYGDDAELADELASYNRPGFRVIFRGAAMRRHAQEALYPHCLALPFWGYVDSGGNVWGCLRHIGEEAFRYGNFLDQPARDILTGTARLSAIRAAENTLDISDCHGNCRMEPANQWLWRLRHPGPHVNFI